jgi:putative membrane protein
MGMYEGYHFAGMHLLWWIVWALVLFRIFASPYSPFRRKTKIESPLEILNRRFASGEITQEQYMDHKTILEHYLGL